MTDCPDVHSAPNTHTLDATNSTLLIEDDDNIRATLHNAEFDRYFTVPLDATIAEEPREAVVGRLDNILLGLRLPDLNGHARCT